MKVLFLQVLMILFLAPNSRADLSPAEAKVVIGNVKYLLQSAEGSGSQAIDATLYPDFPNRVESICFRAARFVQVLTDASMIADSSIVALREVGELAARGEAKLAPLCGPIAAHNPAIKNKLQSSDQIQAWIEKLIAEVNALRKEAESLAQKL